jgi:diketogulonate reductase-like aldo/keto reductase
VTTKLAIDNLLIPEKSFEESLKRLNMDHVDLYLIHWPFFGWQKAWMALEKIYKAGLARAIGVSNFDIFHLEELKKFGSVAPMANEVEITPFLSRKKLVDYCQSKGIAVIAYSPLAMGKRFNDPTLLRLANVYDKSSAQIMIRWGLQSGLVMIPKSETENHIKENHNVFDFEIGIKDMQKLDMLDKNQSMMPLWSRG